MKKAQINLGFVISLVLITALIIGTILSVLQWVPGVRDVIDQNAAVMKADDLSALVFNDPGIPKNWNTTPIRGGLGKNNAYSQRTVQGELDLVKVNYVNTSMTYNAWKVSMGLDNDTHVRILIMNQSQVLLDLYGPLPFGTSVATTHRVLVIGKSEVNATLWAW